MATTKVTTGILGDDAVTLAHMAAGTDGNIISYDASGNPVAVATGSAGQVLTSAGAGAPPTFASSGSIGIHSMWIPAGSMIPQITNGPSSGLFESSSNDIMSRTLDFNTSTDELAQFTVVMPKSWNEGTVTFYTYWTAASGSGTVLWSYAGGSFADSLALDTALGSEAVTAADTLLTALDVHVSPVSAACTIANSPAAGGLVIIRVRRDVSGDTLGVDAKLLGVQMIYTTDAGTDA